MKFSGHILIFGCGSVARCTIPLILKELNVKPNQLTVIDFVDNSSKIPAGINYLIEEITPENYKKILSAHLKKGDILLELAWNISTLDLLFWCKEHGVLYVNSATELWDFKKTTRIEEKTLYHRHMAIREATKG